MSLSSIMSLFTLQGGASIAGANGVQVAAPPPPNNPSQVNNPGQPLPGTNPGNPAAPENQNQNQETNPLDALKDFWTPPDPKNSPAQATVADMFKNVDMTKLTESASKVDFKGVATPEQLAKINAGGAEAMSTMLEVMNAMSQRAYLQSVLGGMKVTERALNTADGIYKSQIPSLVKSAAAADGLRSTEGMDLSHPALAPIVGAFQQQFMTKNPNATPMEIQVQVVDALKAIGQALNPGKVDTGNNSGTPKEEDWSSFLA